MLKEFKEFIMKGNLLEIAVGLILALAFKAVIDAFVNGIISPIIGAIVGETSFKEKYFELGDGRIQISTNVHDPVAIPLGELVEAIRAEAARDGAEPRDAELVGLVPAAALAGYPADVPIRGFDAERHTIEPRIAALTH